ncbi:uncharacterized protein LOC105700506 isoform X1 [Orussus abietinus]|uniref:uncharacterized protein LOC105700506 isoform X1 n=1 Tax=Orussus abietinus TaxID=222816 RepID=UPI00062518F7|nr:uncharacterized protein LOC105700506 isoform X1 [Orussus abietinus]
MLPRSRAGRSRTDGRRRHWSAPSTFRFPLTASSQRRECHGHGTIPEEESCSPLRGCRGFRIHCRVKAPSMPRRRKKSSRCTPENCRGKRSNSPKNRSQPLNAPSNFNIPPRKGGSNPQLRKMTTRGSPSLESDSINDYSKKPFAFDQHPIQFWTFHSQKRCDGSTRLGKRGCTVNGMGGDARSNERVHHLCRKPSYLPFGVITSPSNVFMKFVDKNGRKSEEPRRKVERSGQRV